MIVQKIIDSIAETLSGHFPDTEIYTEEAKQGLNEPCFFILPVDVSDIRHRGNRWLAEYTVCVQYIPSDNEPKARCAEVEEILYKALEYVRIDGAAVGGMDIHSETTDEVLSFFVSYRMLTLETSEENADSMGEYTLNSQVKG